MLQPRARVVDAGDDVEGAWTRAVLGDRGLAPELDVQQRVGRDRGRAGLQLGGEHERPVRSDVPGNLALADQGSAAVLLLAIGWIVDAKVEIQRERSVGGSRDE